MFVLLMVLMQAVLALIVKGVRLQNDFQYYAFNHYSHRSTAYRRAFWHDIGFSYTQSILLMCLPLGIGLFLMQVFYYERRYPNWEVPLNIKLRLKYMYILTLLEYVAVYICLFILK